MENNLRRTDQCKSQNGTCWPVVKFTIKGRWNTNSQNLAIPKLRNNTGSYCEKTAATEKWKSIWGSIQPRPRVYISKMGYQGKIGWQWETVQGKIMCPKDISKITEMWICLCRYKKILVSEIEGRTHQIRSHTINTRQGQVCLDKEQMVNGILVCFVDDILYSRNQEFSYIIK